MALLRVQKAGAEKRKRVEEEYLRLKGEKEGKLREVQGKVEEMRRRVEVLRGM